MEDNPLAANTTKRIRPLLVPIVLLLILFIAFMVYQSVTFRLVGTDPSTDSVATISPFLKINFNKPLARTVLVSIGPQNFPISYGINGSVITVTFEKTLQEGQTYYIHLANIADVAGARLPNKTIGFEAKYINSASLPPDQQKALQAKQKSYDAIKSDGLVRLLPFTGGGNEFEVSYTVNYSNQNPRLIIIITATTPQGQADALNWIREVGFDPSKYTITYVSPNHGE